MRLVAITRTLPVWATLRVLSNTEANSTMYGDASSPFCNVGCWLSQSFSSKVVIPHVDQSMHLGYI